MTFDPWITHGYAGFYAGSFGNGGQNLYVSRAGVLQRIFRYDFTNDGYFDLLFVNSQDMNERLPMYVYADPLQVEGRIELPTRGAYAAAVGDLNGDGIDELVIGNQCDGGTTDLTAFIYYGSEDGWSEQYTLELPAPNCRGVALGDFNGDGHADLVFACNCRLRFFYQAADGFYPSKYTELPLDVAHMVAADLDGDGITDLYVRPRVGLPLILWGGADGLHLQHATPVGNIEDACSEAAGSTPDWAPFMLSWRPKILRIDGVPYVFRAEGADAALYPVRADRSLGTPLMLHDVHAAAAAVGDITGNGCDDLVLISYAQPGDSLPGGYPSQWATSWIYWGGPDGFSSEHRSPLTTMSARDVVVTDLDADGYAEVLICQGSTNEAHSVDSLIFRGSPEGLHPEPVHLPGHDPTTVLVAYPSPAPMPQVVLVNHVSGRVRGDMPLYLYHGGPDGYRPERRSEIPGWAAPDAVECDFFDDGWADLFVSNCSENATYLDPGSFLYLGGPQGFSSERKLVFPTFRAHGSAVGDFRHSGYLDIAVAGFSNPELRIFRQGLTGFDLEHFDRILLDPHLQEYTPSRECDFNYEASNAVYREPRWLLAADFNGNGWLDLFVSQICGPRSLILWGGPDGFSLQRAQWLHVEGASCAQAADLTGNGWLDLVIGCHQSLSNTNNYDAYVCIYWGGPDGYREDRRAQLPISGCNSLTIADFNRDGVLDIFATAYKNGRVRDLDSLIYWGAPGGRYSVTNRTRLFSHSASGCVAADFNGDGWVDMAVACHKTYGNHAGESQVWWNGPDGFAESRRTYLPTLGPHGMYAVDPGNIMDRGQEEYYYSAPHHLPDGAVIRAISWESIDPPNTWVRAQLRIADSREELAAATWQDWHTNGDVVDSQSLRGAWAQYCLALGAANGANSPRVTKVTVEFAAAIAEGETPPPRRR